MAWGDGGGGGGMDFAGTVRRGLSKEERQNNAKSKRIAYSRRMEFEKARMKRGKKEDNYILFENKTRGFTSKEIVAELLEALGLNVNQVISIQNDPERNAVMEVLLDKQVQVDIAEYNKILSDKGYEFEVLSIGMKTESVIVRKLPLTAYPKKMEDQVKTAVRPYVEKILDVIPLKWRLGHGEKEHKYYKLYNGKYDGHYKVIFVPKEGEVIPGFIPVGPEMVKGEVRYANGDEKNLLCSNCFEGGHLRGDEECKGGDGWTAFVKRFNEESKRLMVKEGEDFVPVRTETEEFQTALEEKEAERRRLEQEKRKNEGKIAELKEELKEEKTRYEKDLKYVKERDEMEYNRMRKEKEGELAEKETQMKEMMEEIEKMSLQENGMRQKIQAMEHGATGKEIFQQELEDMRHKVEIIDQKRKEEEKKHKETADKLEKMEKLRVEDQRKANELEELIKKKDEELQNSKADVSGSRNDGEQVNEENEDKDDKEEKEDAGEKEKRGQGEVQEEGDVEANLSEANSAQENDEQTKGMDKEKILEATEITDKDVLEVSCKGFKAKFHMKEWNGVDGRSKCILYNDDWISPGEFEKKAGSKANKWKTSLQANGGPIGMILDAFTNKTEEEKNIENEDTNGKRPLERDEDNKESPPGKARHKEGSDGAEEESEEPSLKLFLPESQDSVSLLDTGAEGEQSPVTPEPAREDTGEDGQRMEISTSPSSSPNSTFRGSTSPKSMDAASIETVSRNASFNEDNLDDAFESKPVLEETEESPIKRLTGKFTSKIAQFVNQFEAKSDGAAREMEDIMVDAKAQRTVRLERRWSKSEEM